MTDKQRGAVSIFLVIFFSLLISVIVLSFVSIVLRDAGQSANNDLSRSAYDSAQAGVEDGKRAIAAYLNACNTGSANCATYGNYLNKDDCSALPIGFNAALGLNASGGEVPVQSNGDTTFNQAYTCVNVTLNTPDYVNTEPEYQSDIIPLQSSSGFNSVTVSWFTQTDSGNQPFTPPSAGGSNLPLPKQAAWGGNGTPAMLRLELFAAGNGNLTSADLDSNLRTIFLYPSSSGSANAVFATRDGTHDAPATGQTIVASKCGTTGVYSCSTTVAFGGLGGNSEQKFLRVTPIYKGTTFKVELGAPGSGTLFNGVQPIIDSTGRANDLFRRVEARVRTQNFVMYPEFAVDTRGSLCKNFSVGADPADFINNCP